jgi:DNA-binding transcriptional LysR family regulator
MELQQLKYFKTVAETGKISAAAEALFLSAPALSTAISRLEKELGTTLFDRTGNRILLNAQGVLFLRHVDRILDELEEAKAELRQTTQQTQHISMATVSSAQWVDLISAFTQENPGVPISCTSLKFSHLAEGGLPAEFTFLFASEDALPEAYARQMYKLPLFEDYPVIVVRGDHPLCSRTSVDIRDLEKETLFLPMSGYSLYAHLTALFESSGLPLPSGNSYPHLVCQQMAAEGHGITFASAHTARIPASNLHYIPIRSAFRPWTAYLYWKKNRKLNRNEQIFMSFVERYYQKDREALSIK